MYNLHELDVKKIVYTCTSLRIHTGAKRLPVYC